MAKKHQKVQNQQEQQIAPQPTAPATPLELTEEELEQVVGGSLTFNQPPSTGPGGLPTLTSN